MDCVPRTNVPPSPIRVLLIEDDLELAETVLGFLRRRRLTVQHAPDLATGLRFLSASGYDAVILDLTLPDGDGLHLASHIRAAGSEVPILMLTARASVPDRVAGFQHGADDYLCKPFNMEELIARLQAILRRALAGNRHLLRYADLQLDLLSRAAQRKDVRAALSDREACLLAYLISHPEEVLPRDRVLEEVWGDEAEDDSNVLNVYINYLRNKIESPGEPRLIHTIRGVGYMLSEKAPEELS
ncbi:MAG: response regulator transcription factor [Planctomycetes bacterium]|nr:response regulator transcription factor [Planctomycetota bacterium]